MELVKKHEQYVFTDNHENGWIATGNTTIEVDGALHIWISITNDGNDIGSINYRKPGKGFIDFNVTCEEENRDTVTTYADTLVDYVLDHFKL